MSSSFTQSVSQESITTSDNFDQLVAKDARLSGAAALEKFNALKVEVETNYSRVVADFESSPDENTKNYNKGRVHDLTLVGYRAAILGARLGEGPLKEGTTLYVDTLNGGLAWRAGRGFGMEARFDAAVIAELLKGDDAAGAKVQTNLDNGLLRAQLGFLQLTKLGDPETGILGMKGAVSILDEKDGDKIAVANYARQLYLHYGRVVQETHVTKGDLDAPVYVNAANEAKGWTLFASRSVTHPDAKDSPYDRDDWMKNTIARETPLLGALMDPKILQEVVQSFLQDSEKEPRVASLQALPLFNRASTILLKLDNTDPNFYRVVDVIRYLAVEATFEDDKKNRGPFNKALSELLVVWSTKLFGNDMTPSDRSALQFDLDTAKKLMKESGRTDYDSYFEYVGTV